MYFFGKPAGERRGNFRWGEENREFREDWEFWEDWENWENCEISPNPSPPPKNPRTLRTPGSLNPPGQKKSASETRKPNLRAMRLPDYFSAGASAGATSAAASAGAASAAASHFSQAQASPSAHLAHSSAFSHCSQFSQHAFSSAAAFFLLQLPQQPTIATAATRTTNEKIFFIALMN